MSHPDLHLDRLTFTGDRVEAQLDNLLTVAMLVHLFTPGVQGTVLFSADDEAGRSWRYVREHFLRCQQHTDQLLVVDTSPFPDEAAANEADLVLRRRDAKAPFCAHTVERVAGQCAEMGIRTLFKDELIAAENAAPAAAGEAPKSLGGTELGRLVAGSEGALTGPTPETHRGRGSA